MNRKKIFNKLPHAFVNGDFTHENDEYCWKNLTVSQERKCRQRFEAYKPEGCSKISRKQIQKMLHQNGIQIDDREVLNMLWQADPKGQGLIDYESFCHMIENCKKKKHEQVNNFIGLTFDEVLQEQRKKMNDPLCQEVSWQFLKYYLRQNFELEVSVNGLIGKNKAEKPLSRNQFMNIFS